MENILFLIIGIITGSVIAWLIRKFVTEKKLVSMEAGRNHIEHSLSLAHDELDELKKEKESSQNKIVELSSELSSSKTFIKSLEDRLSSIEEEKKDFRTEVVNKTEELNSLHRRVSELSSLNKAMTESLADVKGKNKELELSFKNKTDELTKSKEKVTELVEQNKALDEKLRTQKKEMEELGIKFNKEFENLANKIFDEKSEKFTRQNKDNLKDILKPLGDNIESFKRKVEETYDKESKQRFSLEEKIKDLVTSSHKLSKDAEHLTLALKGDSKAQGNWGEDLLERILSAAGLKKEIHYQKQATLADDMGKDLRPDYIIKLPGNRVLIIDSKVSLTAYNDFYNAVDEKERDLHLKAHLTSINKHIKELSEKNYHDLSGNTPNYVIMFIPLDGAFYAALDREKDFYLKALDKNIVVVTTSTLLATLRTISYMWKQEDQKRNVVEIARESGALYDKFVGFVKDLDDVGKKLDATKVKYDDAMNKLTRSTKKGDTIVGRIERIKALGASTNKSLPQELVEKIDDPES